MKRHGSHQCPLIAILCPVDLQSTGSCQPLDALSFGWKGASEGLNAATMADHLDTTPLPSRDEKRTVAANVHEGQQLTAIPTTTAPKAGRLGALKGWLLPRSDQTPWAKFLRFFTFLGPGAIISVAYIDPDNYQVAISSGGSFQYKLLFMVLVSNIIAIYLQVRFVSETLRLPHPLPPDFAPLASRVSYTNVIVAIR